MLSKRERRNVEEAAKANMTLFVFDESDDSLDESIKIMLENGLSQDRIQSDLRWLRES